MPSKSLNTQEQRFRQLKAQLAQIGYFAKGTVLTRMMKCGKSQCACHTNPSKRHGPYYEWTYKHQGKTVNVRLSAEAVGMHKSAAQQYRKLKSILNKLEKLSRQVLAKLAKQAAKRTGK